MKIKIVYLAIFIVTTVAVGAYYLSADFFNKKQDLPEINLTQLEKVQSNGSTYLTTGSLISEDKETVDELNLIIDLGKMGIVETSKFTIYPSKKGKIVIELQEPYESSRIAVSNWLRDNGFGPIGENNFTYINK